MKKTFKKAISVLLIAVMVLCSAPLAGFVGIELPEFNLFITKAEAAKSGTCGENLTWTFDESTSKLTISGTGEIPFALYQSIPWDIYSSIKTVEISDGVTGIGYRAFMSCSGLTNIIIPDSVTSIGQEAFYYCSELVNITIDPDNDSYSSDEYGVLFNRDKTALVYYPEGHRRTSYTIPDGVETIGYYSFMNNSYLMSLEIPDTVVHVEQGAFSESAIYENPDNWEDSVLYIDDCLIKAEESIPGDYTVRGGTRYIGEGAFVGCFNLENLILPDSLKIIDRSAFAICYSLEDIILPDGVTNVGEYAFFNCMSMEYIHIPSSVTSIGEAVVPSDSDKASFLEYLKNISDDELAEIGLTKEKVEKLKPTTLICSDSENSAAKTFAEENGNQFAVCDGHDDAETPDTPENPNLITGTCGDNLTWTFDESMGELIISGTGDMWDFSEKDPWLNYREKIKTVTVGDGVTSIGYSAFGACTSLTEIILPDSMKIIDEAAFVECTGLTSITLPDGLTSIGRWAFENCTSLKSITLPKGLKSIGEEAFSGCTGLTEIVVDYVGTCDFGGDNYTFKDCDAVTTVIIGDEVTRIENYALSRLKNLKNVEIGSGVTSVGAYAFASCYSLTDITIPDNVTSIGECAFFFCHKLENVTIPDSVTSIGTYAFYYCLAMDSLHIPSSVTTIGGSIIASDSEKASAIEEILDMSDEEFADFRDNQELTKEEIAGWLTTTLICSDSENSVAKTFAAENGNQFSVCNGHDGETPDVPDTPENPDLITGVCGDNLTWTFDESTGKLVISGTGDMWDWENYYVVPWREYVYNGYVKEVIINNGVTSIGSSAFEGAESLTSITLSDSVTVIGENAFKGCISLTNADIGNGVTDIGYYAFQGCINLSNITIPNSVTSIGGSSFCDCTSLSDITIPDSVASIYSYAFANTAYYNDKANWEDSVLYIGNHLVSAERTISGTYHVKEGTKTIANSAFWGCENLNGIEIPDSIKIIESYVFYNCTNLENITIPNGVTSVGESTFQECKSLESIIIPDSVVSLDDYVFKNCTSLNNIVIPDSVKDIGVDSFENTALYNDNSNWENDVLYIGNHLITAKTTLSGEYQVKEGTKTIAGCAFSDCANLTGILIPDGVTNIGVFAFSSCLNLTDVSLPDSVTRIGYGAFGECALLKTITIPESVREIENVTFSGCSSLEGVFVPEGITSIGEVAFAGCFSMKYIHIPSSVMSISDNAIMSDSEKAEFVEMVYEMLENATEEELAEYAKQGITKELVANWKPTTLICSDSENSAAKTFAEENGNQFAVCNGHDSGETPDTPENPDLITGECGDNLTWTFDESTGELVISGTGDMWGWSALSSIPWYSHHSSIKTVTISDSVTSIGEKAFAYCDSLANVTIPDGVTSIGFNAFGWCESLISVTIGNSLTRIDDFAFISCNSLISITVDSSNTSYSSDEYGVLFNKNKTVLIQYPAGNTRTSYAIPDSVEFIVGNAFYHCKNLTSVIIPYSVIDIGNEAFSNCESLTSVIIPDSVLSIGSNAFYNCSSLVSVKISGSVTSIGERAFGWCKSLESITVDSTNTSYSSDEYGVLFNKDKTVLIHYPTGNTRISYTIPDSVTGIEDSAFEFCANLTSVTIGNSVKSIGNYAFVLCPRLERITIPDSVTTIGERVFLYCFRLEFIHISSSVTRIGDSIILSDSERADFIASFEDVWNNESEDTREIMESIGITPETSATWPQTTVICSDSEDAYAKTFAEQNGNQFKVCGGDHRKEFTATFIVDDVQTVITLKEGDAIPVENPVKEGHTFVEWTPAIPEVMPSENLEFTAVFEVNSYSVNWIIDGMMITETHKFGEMMDKSKSFEKHGYTFIGWSPEIPETMPAHDLEFTAIFEINICDAVFNANGGAFPDGDLVKRIATEQNAEIFAPENPERAGYQFAGWAYNGKNIGTNVGVMDSTEGKIFDAVWIPNEKTSYKVETYTMNTYGEYEVSYMLVNAFVSEEVSVNPTASEGFEINEEKSVLSGTVTSEEMLVLKVYIDRKQYKFTTVVFDTETTVFYYYGAVVTGPDRPYIDGYVFQYWEPSVPVIMPPHDVTVTAKFRETTPKPRIEMVTPEKRTIYYGESITLQVRTYDMPSYAKIKWEVSGDGVSIKPSSSGKTCKVTSTSNGNVVVKAYIVDSDGNTIEGKDGKPIYDYEYLYSEVNLWQIIVNFFRQLFNKNNTASQVFKYLF